MSATATTISETWQWLHHSDESVSMDNNNYGYGSNSSVCEIEEEENSSELYLDETHHQDGPMATISEEENEGEDTVYVAVGKSDTSKEALSWTLKNLATQSTTVFLIHVFPEIKHVPNPCK